MLNSYTFTKFSIQLLCINLPERAATSAALKFGSLVNELAICSTKTLGTCSGESTFGFVVILESLLLLGLDFVKSRVTVGAEELIDAEQGTEPMVIQRFGPDVASI